MTGATRAVLTALVAGALLGGCAASGGGGTKAAGGSAEGSAALMAPLKSLAGTWTMRDENGQEQVALVTKVIAGGSVVHETMFPGSQHEMVNTYHADGGSLVVTHYCAAGNQPRMECTSAAGGVYKFRFRDITNHSGPDEHYMGELTVKIIDADHLVQVWASFQNGQRTEGPTFEMTRRKG